MLELGFKILAVLLKLENTINGNENVGDETTKASEYGHLEQFSSIPRENHRFYFG